ncbi:MAG: hypothetical protein L6R43_18450 [Planctomycetes bacterium]|nr:hypothetical protein [Planctomycetota bacterium]
MLRAGETYWTFPDLGDLQAVTGRRVRVGATVYLRSRPSAEDAQAATDYLAVYVLRGVPGSDNGEIREAPGGYVLETSLDGDLRESWTRGALLRSIEEGTAELLAARGLSVSDVEGAALDQGPGTGQAGAGVATERVFSDSFEDTAGTVNPDRSLNWGAIVGKGTGDFVRTVGTTAGNALGGFASGLGLVGTIALVLVILAVLVVLVLVVKGGV